MNVEWFFGGSVTTTMHKWNDVLHPCRVEQKVQVVLRRYEIPAKVVYGFVVDCCGCSFDGRQVWVTPRSLHADVNVLNPLHAFHRKAYETRLAKYAHGGFAQQVAGVNACRIDYNAFVQMPFHSTKVWRGS